MFVRQEGMAQDRNLRAWGKARKIQVLDVK